MYQYKETNPWKNDHGVTVSEGVLTLDQDTFRSISGGGGRGALPAGKYKLMPAYQLAPTHDHYDSYCREGLAFFAPIIAMFPSDRTDLGVHPDGAQNGTNGCVGLKEKIAIAYSILSELPKDGVEFEVIKL